MIKSSPLNDDRSSCNSPLSIDLKSIYKSNPNQEEGINNYKIFQSPNQNMRKNKIIKQTIKKSDGGLNSENDNDKKNNQYKHYSAHRQNHSQQNKHLYQSSRQARSNNHDSYNKKISKDHNTYNNLSNQYKKASNNGFDNSKNYDHLKFSYKNCDSNDIDNNINEEDDGEVSATDFDEVYHFNCKQYIEEGKISNVRNFYTLCSTRKNQNENTKKRLKCSDRYLNHLDEELKSKMVFHDSDQIDDSLITFIEEEELFEKNRIRHRSHRNHHRRHRRKDNAIKSNDNLNYLSDKINRRPLNQKYQKYMSSSSRNDNYIHERKYAKSLNDDMDNYNNFKDENNVNKKGKNNSYNSEYSIFEFSDKTLPISHFCGENTLLSNKLNSVTFSISTSRKDGSSTSKKSKSKTIDVDEFKSKIKFVGSDEISSPKANEFIDSSDDQNDVEEEINEFKSIPDLRFNEDINLKITMKDTNSVNKEKVQHFNIYSSTNESEFNNYNEIGESEEKEEKIDNPNEFNRIENKNADFLFEYHPLKSTVYSNTNRNENKRDDFNSIESNSIKDNNNYINDCYPKNDKGDISLIYNSNIGKNNNSFANNETSISKNSINNDNKSYYNSEYNYLYGEEEEDSTTEFCDVSTTYDLQAKNAQNNEENRNENSKATNSDLNSNAKQKIYKTAEINVKLKDIREAVGNINSKSNSVHKEKNESEIVTTHRKKLKKKCRKKLIDKYSQTDEVENPELTLAMLKLQK